MATQRGNRRQETFFIDDDYQEYLHLMAEWCIRCKVEVWSYCLMPNHLIAVPESEDGLRRAIGEAHRRYTKYINFGRETDTFIIRVKGNFSISSGKTKKKTRQGGFEVI